VFLRCRFRSFAHNVPFAVPINYRQCMYHGAWPRTHHAHQSTRSSGHRVLKVDVRASTQ
jgi:hypothetical protein